MIWLWLILIWVIYFDQWDVKDLIYIYVNDQWNRKSFWIKNYEFANWKWMHRTYACVWMINEIEEFLKKEFVISILLNWKSFIFKWTVIWTKGKKRSPWKKRTYEVSLRWKDLNWFQTCRNLNGQPPYRVRDPKVNNNRLKCILA